ncbi:hypothetical protein QT397_02085 (plasmid) [Microbulbifer sp. MKSA007]|nr:hypothetical protein QT397_02085 [Microbulbifer sp. MKSA007]
MTTDIVTTIAPDISTRNEVYNLGKVDILDDFCLSGISWALDRVGIENSRASVLRHVFSLISEKIPSLDIWLIAGSPSWQLDNRVTRYQKLWKALKSAGIEVSHAGKTLEVANTKEGNLKFFGAKLLSELSLVSAEKAIEDNTCSYLLAVPSDIELSSLLREGWSGEYNQFDHGLVKFVAQNNGLILKAFGAFDDVDVGFTAIGHPDLIRTLTG